MLLSKLGYYVRMSSGVASLLRTRPHVDPDGVIREQMEKREERFLELARRVIFSNPANPYHQMFQLAGCKYPDLAEAVRRDGLEATLVVLHRQGVYLSHDEFKRKKPIRRSNREIPAGPDSFGNPLIKGGTVTSSGGSRSEGTKTRKSASEWRHWETYLALIFREFGMIGRPHIQLKPVLPSGDGILFPISSAQLGCPIVKWFSSYARALDSTHYQTATRCLVGLARLYGVRVPFPHTCRPTTSRRWRNGLPDVAGRAPRAL